MFSGIKTTKYTMGYDSGIDYRDIKTMSAAKEVETIMTWAQEADMDTGSLNMNI